jgi:hypothetical protein
LLRRSQRRLAVAKGIDVTANRDIFRDGPDSARFETATVAKQTAAMAEQMALRRSFRLGAVVITMLVSDVAGKAA